MFDLAASVPFAENATVSKMVINWQTGNITLFAFGAGQGLSEHSAPFDAFVQVIEGKGRIIITNMPQHLKTGEFILMLPHFMQCRHLKNSK